MRPVASLPPEVQARVVARLRADGRIRPVPPPRDPSVLWCGHLAAEAVEELTADGPVLVCPRCGEGP